MRNNRRIRLLYDGTILADGLGHGSNRSGIFMVVYHIFCELLKNPHLDIMLYSDPSRMDDVKRFIQTDPVIKNYTVPIINDPVRATWGLGWLERSIGVVRAHKDQLCAQHKCFRCQGFRGVLLLQKIVRKVLRKIFERPSVMQKHDPWNSIQAAFSPVFPHLPEVLQRKGIKRYTILYDAIPYIFPDLFPDTKDGCSWNLNLLAQLGEEDVCFAISEQTKKDFLYFSKLFRENHSDFYEMFSARKDVNQYTSEIVKALENRKKCNESTCMIGSGTTLRPENIEVALLAAAERFHHTTSLRLRETVLTKYNIPLKGKYIFTLCTLEKRKNITYAIRNFLRFVDRNKAMDLFLVLGGGSWFTYQKELDSILADSKAKQQVFRIGYVDDQDVSVLFSNALCTVYPSIYEGFGLPVLEAMQCGCPVIAADNSSIPEVLGDAGILIDINSDQSLLDALEKLYKNPDLCKEYSARGLARAKLFSWEKAGAIIGDRILRDFQREKGI